MHLSLQSSARPLQRQGTDLEAHYGLTIGRLAPNAWFGHDPGHRSWILRARLLEKWTVTI